MNTEHVIAVDLGASSGRVMRVAYDGARLALSEAHRFPNVPVMAGGTLYWDALRIWHEIQVGIEQAAAGALSIGLDCWGVDTALLDRDGNLLANPVHYRDLHKEGGMDWVFERVPRREVFERTGIQFLSINGLYQLAAMLRDASPVLANAATLLTIADLFNYWLTGSRTVEYTEASTLQMLNPRTGDWDYPTVAALGIPQDILPPIVPPGTRLGEYQGIPVIAPACHDTGSAVVAVPMRDNRHAAYLSSGTWSLIGVEVDAPLINDAVYEANITNEGGVNGTTRLLKNVAGMWLLEQCKATWARQGQDHSYEAMNALAAAAAPFRSFIDPDDPSFLPAGDMPAWIRQFCEGRGQPSPQDAGQTLRAIYESLALKYRYVLDRLEGLTGRRIERLHIIGGGSQNELLCQMSANATGREVLAGPVEATALGNGIMQLITLGRLESVSAARAMLAETMIHARYTPQHSADWEAAYKRFVALLSP